VITQQGQVIKLRTRGADGKLLWACCYRVDGRGSARPQVGGFASQGEALRALKVALARQHRGNGRVAQITLSELVEEYLVQHEAEPRPIRSCTGCWRRRRARSASAGLSSCARMRSAPGVPRCRRGIASRRPRRCARC
jgi:hypothetical protein